MRITNSQTVARPSALDRNPILRTNSFQNTATAPHASTQRWIYTVPAGKRTEVRHATVHVLRDGAAGAAGLVLAQVIYTPNAGAQAPVCVHGFIDATLGRTNSMNVGVADDMVAGDTIQGLTQDGSTGGTVLYTLNWGGIEFDV